MLDHLAALKPAGILFLGDIFELWIALKGYEMPEHKRFVDWCRSHSKNMEIGFIEGIVLLCKDQEAFDDEYNDGVSPYTQYYQQQQYAAPQQPQQHEAPQPQQQTPAGNAGQGKSKTEQLLELKQLLDGGILTQEEFDTEKQKILNS